MTALSPADEITRYIFDDKHYSQPEPKARPGYYRIKKNAIAPMRNAQGEYETSVMKTAGCSDEAVASLGTGYVAEGRGEDVVAHARFVSEIAFEKKLSVIHDKNGHELHCAIKGWPADKSDMMERAGDLAEAISNHVSKIFLIYPPKGPLEK